MWILAFFTHAGIPATGLSPLVKVLDIETGSAVVDNEGMSETGAGFYRYDFTTYDIAHDYAIICDSVTLSGTERYTYASSGEYNNILYSISSTIDIIDIRTTLIRKIQTNKLELSDGDTGNWILYDDPPNDNVALLTFNVTDKNGNLIIQPANIPSRRSKGY